MKSIGIDIGTTTISGVVYDSVEDRNVHSVTVDNGSFIRSENDWERIQDAGGIVDKAAGCWIVFWKSTLKSMQ